MASKEGKENYISKGSLSGDITEKYPIRVLLLTAFKRIGGEVYECREDFAFRVVNPLKPFYDALFGLIVDLLGPEDDELVIVSNSELCLTHGPQLLNGLGFALFHHLRVINWS